jgi:hypothetical protein
MSSRIDCAPGECRPVEERENQASIGAMRELTVEDLLDRRIEKLHLQMKALQDIKGSLSQSFLRSGASRISAILEL